VGQRFSLVARLKSFGYAFAGLRTLVVEQHNARLHLLATVLVVALALGLQVSRGDWLALLLAMALVWLAEAMNSALEYLCDAAVPQQHPLIAHAKDVAAAGVLMCSGVAVLVAILVFPPYF
jgi:diacylglycerol kinase